MLSLFPDLDVFPPGFKYYPGFISMEEEEILSNVIRSSGLHNMIFQCYEAKRKTASFGLDWSFEKRILTQGNEIPSNFNWLIKKVEEWFSLQPGNIAELLLTEYPVGSVINWHRDAPPFDMIIGISLNSDCTFRLRPYDKALQRRKSILSINVERRSVYMMSEESRSAWEHSISPVKQIRFSITMRTLKV